MGSAMNTNLNRNIAPKPRITLSGTDLDRLFQVNGTQSVPVLAKRTGVSYMLIYNIVHRRVRSVSYRHYTRLFGGPPPAQAPLKVDGRIFRNMVDLWLYLNDGLTRADLFRELHGLPASHKVDHRLFNGKTKAVNGKLVHAMQQKFAQAGIDEPLLKQWLDEFSALSPASRVPYTQIRPTLVYLQEKLDLHPTSVLKQSVTRYESGALKSVPIHIAEHAEALRKATENVLQTDSRMDIDRLRASVLGGKNGYTLYADIREALRFVIDNGGRGAKYFLGRSLWTYEQGNAKYIANWRVRKILDACDAIIRQKPTLALSVLPRSRQGLHVRPLLDVLHGRTSQLLCQKDGIDLEKQILRPSHRRDEYGNPYHGFTPFEMASQVLGMRRRAFDLMVTENREIFRSVGRFSQRWYLSDLYLRELSGKENFKLVLAKYEWMARHRHRRQPAPGTCFN
jgi:hypothetical protein